MLFNNVTGYLNNANVTYTTHYLFFKTTHLNSVTWSVAMNKAYLVVFAVCIDTKVKCTYQASKLASTQLTVVSGSRAKVPTKDSDLLEKELVSSVS